MTTPVEIIPANDVALLQEKLTKALAGEITVFISQREVNGVKVEITDLPETATNTALIIESSGSTGIPKRIYLSADALRAATASSASVIGSGQWLLSLPTNYVAGAMVLVRSILSGTRPVVMNTGVSFTAQAFALSSTLLTEENRFVSLVPTQLLRLYEATLSDSFLLNQLKKFSAVLVGGQAVSESVVDYFRENDVNVVSSYGMAETAGGCVYDGLALPGVNLRINDNGTLAISGAMLANDVADATGYLNTQDLAELEDGKLKVLGRIDRVINSGGLKISIDQIEDVALSIGGVVEVAGCALDSEQWGQRVGLVYVGSPEVADYLAAAVFEQLGVAAKPIRVIRVDRIPRLTSGKTDLITLEKLFEGDK
jgi:O-succinylbenzoic acid--CoA ligase